MTAVPWPADFADLTPDGKRAVLIARFAARGIHLIAFGSPYPAVAGSRLCPECNLAVATALDDWARADAAYTAATTNPYSRHMVDGALHAARRNTAEARRVGLALAALVAVFLWAIR